MRTAIRWLIRAQGSPEDGLGAWSDAEVQKRVYAALERMKFIHRAVFVLYELEGLSGQQVAEAVGVPFATVRRRLHNARAEFEALIAGEEAS